MSGGVHGGAWRCMEGCAEEHAEVCRGMHRGAWRCTEGCTEGCMEVHGGVHGGAWRGVWRWLPLATINLVGDNREFEV